MTVETAAERPLTPEQYERVLQARLGLPPAASSEDVDAAHRAVTAYLAHAPRELKDWARSQAAAADEAYAMLIDPVALADSVALVGPMARPAAMPGGPATPPARRDLPAATRQASKGAKASLTGAPATAASAAHEPTFEELLAEVTPSSHRDTSPNHRRAAKANTLSGEPVAPARRLPFLRLALVGGALVGAVAIAVAGYQVGGAATAAASPSPSAAAAAASPALDQVAVAALMSRIQADPKDTEALMSLADQYYIAEDFVTAETWLGKLLAVDASHVRGLLALGAVQFNLGRMDDAKGAWEKVVAVEPDNVEAHYDLGFYYLNQSPPDMVGVQAEWGRVVEISPDSEIAKTVKSHLDALASPAPSSGASTAPGASPAASAAPGASPAASAAPSAAASPAASGSAQP
jgi:tetratricopeptide (TPR) repeat protein